MRLENGIIIVGKIKSFPIHQKLKWQILNTLSHAKDENISGSMTAIKIADELHINPTIVESFLLELSEEGFIESSLPNSISSGSSADFNSLPNSNSLGSSASSSVTYNIVISTKT